MERNKEESTEDFENEDLKIQIEDFENENLKIQIKEEVIEELDDIIIEKMKKIVRPYVA